MPMRTTLLSCLTILASLAAAPATRPSSADVGGVAPDFTLKTTDGKSEVQLSGFRGKRPVVLVFGSYT